MKRFAVLFTMGTIALSAATPLVRQTFETDTEGWTTFGQNGAVRIAHDPAFVKNGKGALSFDYDASHGPAFAAWPVKAPLTSMRSLSFWLSTDSPTAIAILANEGASGGHYIRTLWSTGKEWQKIELEPSDFTLTDGPNDPPDSDGKLDVDQIQSIGVFDVSQLFANGAKPDFPIAIEARTGKHSIAIDDFEISPDPLPKTAAAGQGVVVDDFSRPFLQWMTLGGMTLSWENHGLRARYQQEEERYPLLTESLPPMDLRGWNRIAFDIASDKPAQLVISFEERSPGKGQGPRYSTTFEVLGGGKAAHRAISFSAFSLDPNGPADPSGELDLDKVKTISIIDITAASTHESTANSLWIGNLRTAEKK